MLDTSITSIVLLLHDTHSVGHENVMDTSIRPSCYCYTTRTACVMKIVLDTSIRPSCYCYTTRTECHENRAEHKYPSIVLLLHDTQQCVMKIVHGHKYPSIVLLLHDTHSVS